MYLNTIMHWLSVSSSSASSGFLLDFCSRTEMYLASSSGLLLLWLANFAADFLMLYVLPERRHYRTYKQERTPDFSDLRNKIAEVEGEKKKLRERKNRFANKYFES